MVTWGGRRVSGAREEEEEEEADLEGGAEYAELDEGHGEPSGGGGGGEDEWRRTRRGGGRADGQPSDCLSPPKRPWSGPAYVISPAASASSLSRSISFPSDVHCTRTTAPCYHSDFIVAAAAPDDEEGE